MPTWKAKGYIIRVYATDHPPYHAHVFKDRNLVAKFDIDNGRFMAGSDERHTRAACSRH